MSDQILKMRTVFFCPECLERFASPLLPFDRALAWVAATLQEHREKSHAAKFYCPEHRYTPETNSGFAVCPVCELESYEFEVDRMGGAK